MKKILIWLFITTLLNSSYSQNSESINQHLKFKGVPINGTLNEFVLEMKKKGFELLTTEDGAAMLQGDFAAYKECYITVSTLMQKDLVSYITVIFPQMDTWSSLSANYFQLKELLTEKYGEPADVVEEFNTSTKPRNDNDKMFEVWSNRCTYYAIFKLENGSIELSIENDSSYGEYVSLSYYDKINSEIIRKTAIDDL